MHVDVVSGDVLKQDVEAIVNPWNRNLLPWWLLFPHGVAGAIRQTAGPEPFKELRKYGLLPIGAAVQTSAGKLPCRSIIHVAVISLIGRSSERSIRLSIKNAVKVADVAGYRTIAFPIIGSGSGGVPVQHALDYMLDELQSIDAAIDVRLVIYHTGDGR